MEEKFRQAIEEAGSLADKMLIEPQEEFVSEFNVRKSKLARINVDKKWINFWWRVNYKRVVSMSAAAAVITIFSTFLLNFKNDGFEQAVVQNHVSLMPATGSVVLKLASGEFVELDSAAAIENKLSGVTIDAQKGVISYAQDKSSKDLFANSKVFKPEYNELSVPKGRSFSVVLSDGTKVWVNALSKLYYPVEFDGAERRVKIEGEAFFEVKKNEKIPFVVETKTYSVKVLGTKFNVNAYSEEKSVATTLVSGSVEIPGVNGASVKLTPGKQFKMDKETKNVSLEDVDTELYTSWMNDVLRIQNSNLELILNVIKRRYDVEVVVQDLSLLNEKFTGKVPLNDNLSVILEQLEKVSDIKFAIEEGRLIVRR